MNAIRLLLALAILWCAGVSCRTTRVEGRCPDSVQLQCMTRMICQYDERRGCEKCVCERGWESDPTREAERIHGGGEE